MKKRTFATTALAIFFLASCTSENTQDTTAATEEHEHHDGMAHGDNMPDQTKVVVETPEFDSVPEPMKRHVAQLVSEYLQLKDALVSSDAAAAKDAANTVLSSAKAIPVATLQAADQKEFAQKQVEDVRQAAEAMAGSSDLAAQRNNLEQLSESVFSLAKAFKSADETLYYQHCPMALDNQGAFWLSTNVDIRNPYFGDSMLKCGSNEEIYKN